jgi:glyoxylase-like metal-dependent hydrolase (beta-lactamase superfamily II)
MKRTLVVIGLLALAGALGSAGMLRAAQLPPQVIKSGFESTDSLLKDVERAENGPNYSAWIVESSRFMNVPHRSFTPDVGEPPFVNLPVNVGIIKGPNGEITLYDSGWKQLAYIFNWNTSCCWQDLRLEMQLIGLNPDDVTKIVVGHGHWDHAGQLSSFPNAVLYIQKEELNQIDFFLNYPVDFNGGHIRAVNTLDPITGMQVGPPAQACARTPVCGYPPQTVQEILGKTLGGKAKIVDGRFQVADGLIIHPAFRGHTYGSQLLQVNTPRGQLVFGSDTYSSWEGIRDWFVANIQQTDTIQQFLAYEKCYVLTSRLNSFNNCISAHEPISYSAAYPITANWWNPQSGHCWRAAELILANGEQTHVPANPNRTPCVDDIVPPHPINP